jgi:hypothetical protein
MLLQLCFYVKYFSNTHMKHNLHINCRDLQFSMNENVQVKTIGNSMVMDQF